MKADEKPNIKDLSASEFAEFLAAAKQPTYRAKQICQWLFREHATDFATMTNLPADLREQLDKSFTIGRLAILRRHDSQDGTVKFLFGLADGRSIESVLIPEKHRLTLCISTQVGCAYGCAFCATALLGFKRNLTCGEIVEQILEAGRTLSDDRRISNIVVMGMGEPLANYAQTLRAIEIMVDASWGLAIAPRKITLSTVGLVPQIEKLMEETNVTLAVSLHAATEELRGRLMPVNRKYSLEAADRLLPQSAAAAAQTDHLRVCVARRRERFGGGRRRALPAVTRRAEQGEFNSVQSPSRQRISSAQR